MTDTATQIPFVDYLVLDDGDPHLTAHGKILASVAMLTGCTACAGCFGTDFTTVKIATTGEVKSFTIVTFAAPGVEVPFVAAVIDCDGTSVRGNNINCPPDPEHVTLGMQVRLATHPVGTDDNGVEAVNYGFEPA